MADNTIPVMGEAEIKQYIADERTKRDVSRADSVSPEIEAEINAMFTYQPWDGAQTSAGTIVRQSLAHAVKTIVENVPPCADRSTAIRKIREARMDCNSAITFRGRY